MTLSTRLFQAFQPGHFPSQRGLVAPHSVQVQRVLGGGLGVAFSRVPCENSRMKSRTRWGLGVAVLVGVAWLGWRSLPTRALQAAVASSPPVVAPTSASTQAPGGPVASAPSSAVAHGATPLANEAPPPAEAARRAAWEQRQRQIAEIERQWCTSAKATHLQLEAARAQSLPAFDSKNPKAYLDAAEASSKGEMPLTSAARASASLRLYEQWAQQLQRRGDATSLRVLLWLGATSPVPGLERDQSRAALKALADTAGDPQAYALWLQAGSFCFQGRYCSPADYQRWALLDPGNVLAWLPALGDQALLAPERWQGLARTQYVRHPMREVFAALAPLVPTEPGLAMEVGLEYLDRLQWSFDPISPTTKLGMLCEKASAPEQRQACAHVADVLGRQPAVSFEDRLGAMGLRAMASEEGGLQSLIKRLQANFQSIQPQRRDAVKAVLAPDFATRPGCDHLPAWREHLQRVHAVGSAAMVDAVMSLR
jgi:hypothetical protein